ncbi:hypothetical protein D9M69_541150 [compost metagenome]
MVADHLHGQTDVVQHHQTRKRFEGIRHVQRGEHKVAGGCGLQRGHRFLDTTDFAKQNGIRVHPQCHAQHLGEALALGGELDRPVHRILGRVLDRDETLLREHSCLMPGALEERRGLATARWPCHNHDTHRPAQQLRDKVHLQRRVAHLAEHEFARRALRRAQVQPLRRIDGICLASALVMLSILQARHEEAAAALHRVGRSADDPHAG